MDSSRDRVLGPLPNPFLNPSGELIQTQAEWEPLREQRLKRVLDIGFGGFPPAPSVFHVLKLHSARTIHTYYVTAGTENRTISFELKIITPKAEGKFPVIVTGDDCFGYWTDFVVQEANKRGFAVAKFNRTVFAPDTFSSDRSFGLYPIYPELQFSALSAWAWGYHRCVDALMQIDFIDTTCIAISGHSRGGKATLLAGATDERVLFTQSNCSGAMGCGCLRYEQYEDETLDIEDHRSEQIGDILSVVPYWLGSEMSNYVGNETRIPFDLHELKAAIAPRWFLETDSLDDIWSNPRGTYQTYRAAKEVFRFLGVPERISAVFRYGRHFHEPNDIRVFLDFVEAARSGRPFLHETAEEIFDIPLIFEWRAPNAR